MTEEQMGLRDFLALQAFRATVKEPLIQPLHGAGNHASTWAAPLPEDIAKACYRMADAMMAARAGDERTE